MLIGFSPLHPHVQLECVQGKGAFAAFMFATLRMRVEDVWLYSFCKGTC
jgi:hypothetical protein